jgi:ABC-type dipeptide/oligopeptide/nickel transport system permease subunit
MEKDVTAYRSGETHTVMSQLGRITRVFLKRKLAIIGLVVVLFVILVAICAPLLAPYDPYKVDVIHKLQNPSWQHLLGTDTLGRDTLSRIIYGSRTSLMVGLFAIAIAAIIGQPLGLIAAFFGGKTHGAIMRLIDALMSIPMILSALVIGTLLGGGLKNVIIALGIGMIAVHARIMCAQALTIMQNDYILAAKSLGASNLRIMLRHVLPNSFPPLLVLVTIEMGICILAEAGLSFLGLGIEPPGAAWGSMVSDGYAYLMTYPILSFAPGIAIMLIVFAFNMVGDGIRDALDPRLRGIL